ncbi:MAG: transporter suffix domain-containing protein [Gammaproteobacteria bacterium]|nr:transporter suffix domain-containing protein [Gammaproteobacteria bacterium]
MAIKNGDFRYKVGLIFIVLSFVTPLFVLLIPFLCLSPEIAVTLSTLFLLGLPEIFFILGAVLAGKKAAKLITQKVKKIFNPSTK